ncbi:MAG: dihydroorotase [Candidatus Hodarchaeales archaeon]
MSKTYSGRISGMLWWLENVRIWYNNQLLDGAIEIDTDTGKIAQISRKASNHGVDGKGLWVLPGMIDLHVHLRDFEESHKEDFRSGSLAALHGGVTTVFDMPNKKPPVVTQEDLARVREKIRKEGLIDIFSYLLFVKRGIPWADHRLLKGIFGGTHGTGKSLMSDLHWITEHFSGILALHLEDSDCFNESAKLHHEKRPPKAEHEAVRKFLSNLPKMKQAHVHIAHLSTSVALAAVNSARKAGITCEATPHHIFLDTESISSLGKRSVVNPPLRAPSDRRAIHQGILNGSIDFVASDHAPHTIEEKENLELAGMPGLETALPLLLTDMAQGNLTLKRIVHLYAEGPASLMGLTDRGIISQNRIADLVLVDPRKKWKLKSDNLQSKCKWSPFEDNSFIGAVAATLKKGTAAFMDSNLLPGSFLDQAPVACSK